MHGMNGMNGCPRQEQDSHTTTGGASCGSACDEAVFVRRSRVSLPAHQAERGLARPLLQRYSLDGIMSFSQREGGHPMATRAIDTPVFDADNHLYETRDSLTKFLPDRYRGVIDYVDVRGRTKIVVRGQISEYIPNPTFEVVARPGAQEDYYRK